MERGGLADEPPFDAVQRVHLGGRRHDGGGQLLPGKAHPASALLRQARSQRGGQPHRQTAPVQHMTILGEIADERVLVRCDQFGEDIEFFPALKEPTSSLKALLRASTGTRPSSVQQWS